MAQYVLQQRCGRTRSVKTKSGKEGRKEGSPLIQLTPSRFSVIAATSPPPVPGSSSAEVVLPAPTMFRAGNYIDNSCLRCRKTVYPTDKIGPLKDYTFFHSGCFRCFVCNCKLTLKTYFNNQVCMTFSVGVM